MANVVIKTDKTKVLIEVDTTVDLGPSASGKTQLIGTTQGEVRIPNTDICVNVNVYRKTIKTAGSAPAAAKGA